MSTVKTYQQSLVDAGSETKSPMLERGSYIPWASRFKRFLNSKKENRKWLIKALEDGPYVFRNITPTGSIIPRNSGMFGRNNRRAYVQGEVVEGMNATNETTNVQRIVSKLSDSRQYIMGQIYNCGGKGHYARNYPKPRVRDSKMEEIEELSANICLMARIQPADQNSDDEPSYESAFVSEVQSSSINENKEPMYPTHTKIINSQDSVLDVSKNEAKKEAVYVRKNKQTDNTFANVVSNKENVIDVAVANASKAKTLLCVSCMQSVLIPCHDKCVAKHKLNVRSNARRTFSVNSRIPKSSETTFVAPKTRFSEKATQSKTLDTTSVASKSKIDEASASKARDKVSSEFKKKKRNMRDKPLSPFMLNKIRTSSLWQKWFES
ncbi:hypothetical protein Tco_0385472 [Tanacetum coccineum]